MLDNYFFQVYDPKHDREIGSVSIKEDCLVRVFMTFTSGASGNVLKINIAFYNLLGQMVVEFPSTFYIDTTVAHVVARLIDYSPSTASSPILGSKFVEQDVAEPAPTPGNENNDDIINAPEYPPDYSDDEIDPTMEEKYDVQLEDFLCTLRNGMASSWNPIA
jgi:hypothetical protein